MIADKTSAPSETPHAAAETFVCSKCGHVNPASADFCIQCHNTLVHRCPKCWHAQRHGGVCENCGTNMALFAEMALERSMAEEDRLWWAQFWAGTAAFVQVLFMPFAGPIGLLRSLVIRLASKALSRR
jgi:ribosomal protein L40E